MADTILHRWLRGFHSLRITAEEVRDVYRAGNLSLSRHSERHVRCAEPKRVSKARIMYSARYGTLLLALAPVLEPVTSLPVLAFLLINVDNPASSQPCYLSWPKHKVEKSSISALMPVWKNRMWQHAASRPSADLLWSNCMRANAVAVRESRSMHSKPHWGPVHPNARARDWPVLSFAITLHDP